MKKNSLRVIALVLATSLTFGSSSYVSKVNADGQITEVSDQSVYISEDEFNNLCKVFEEKTTSGVATQDFSIDISKYKLNRTQACLLAEDILYSYPSRAYLVVKGYSDTSISYGKMSGTDEQLVAIENIIVSKTANIAGFTGKKALLYYHDYVIRNHQVGSYEDLDNLYEIVNHEALSINDITKLYYVYVRLYSGYLCELAMNNLGEYYITVKVDGAWYNINFAMDVLEDSNEISHDGYLIPDLELGDIKEVYRAITKECTDRDYYTYYDTRGCAEVYNGKFYYVCDTNVFDSNMSKTGTGTKFTVYTLENGLSSELESNSNIRDLAAYDSKLYYLDKNRVYCYDGTNVTVADTKQNEVNNFRLVNGVLQYVYLSGNDDWVGKDISSLTFETYSATSTTVKENTKKDYSKDDEEKSIYDDQVKTESKNKIKADLKTPKVTSKSRSDRTIKIKIKKSPKAQGYQMKYGSAKKKLNFNIKQVGKQFKVIRWNKKTDFYFKIRAYRKSNNKMKYSNWTKIYVIKAGD